MPSISQRILWTISGNSAEFTSAVDRARGSAKKFGKATGAAGQLVVALTASVAAAGAAFKVMADDVVAARFEIDKLSKQSGLSAKQIRALELEAVRAGTSLEKLIPKNLAERQLDALINKTGEQARNFQILGVDVQDSTGALRNTGDVYLELVRKAQTLDDSVVGAGAAIKLLGGVGEEALAALPVEALDRINAAAGDFGTRTGPDATRVAGEWAVANEQLKRSFDEIKESLFEALGPTAINWVKKTAATVSLLDLAMFKFGAGTVSLLDKMAIMADAGGHKMERIRHRTDQLNESIAEQTKRFEAYQRELWGTVKVGGEVETAMVDQATAYAMLGLPQTEAIERTVKETTATREKVKAIHELIAVMDARHAQDLRFLEDNPQADPLEVAREEMQITSDLLQFKTDAKDEELAAHRASVAQQAIASAAAGISIANSVTSTNTAIKSSNAQKSAAALAQIEAEVAAERAATGSLSAETKARLGLARTQHAANNRALRNAAIAQKVTAGFSIAASTAQGIAAATAAPPGFPLNAPAIIAVTAQFGALAAGLAGLALQPLPKFHDGTAEAKRYHDGALAVDEFSAALQRGEGILSQRGVAALGAETVSDANDGRTIKGARPNTPANLAPDNLFADPGFVPTTIADALNDFAARNNIGGNLTTGLFD